MRIFRTRRARTSLLLFFVPCAQLEEADTIGSTNGGVASRLSFTVHLPNGSEIRSWSRLSVALQQLHKTNTPEANPHTHADDDAGRRQSSRKRMRPLEYWANERKLPHVESPPASSHRVPGAHVRATCCPWLTGVLYDSGEVVGAISGDTLLAFE